MTQDPRVGERRVSVYRGFVAIFLGILATVLVLSRNDDNSWQGVMLASACFLLAAYFFFDAFRR